MGGKELKNYAWYLIRPVIIYMLLLSVVQAVLFRLLETALLGLRADMVIYYAQWENFFTAVILAIAHAAAVLPLRKEGMVQIRWRQGRDSWIAHRRDRRALEFLMAAGTLSAALCFNSVVLRFFMQPETAFTGWRLAVAILIYGFVTPFTEEFVFRGILFLRLRQITSFLEAGLLSAAVFGIYHGRIAQGVYGFLMGFLFAAAYELTGNFMVPFALHSACNIMILIADALGIWAFKESPFWLVFLFTCAAASILWICRRLRETGWDPRKKPDRNNQ